MNAFRHARLAIIVFALSAGGLAANEPVASYIFPAGGQRGTRCAVHIGGLFLHDACTLDLVTPGLKATSPLKRVATKWFEGPLIPLPESQQAEDYPKDYATDLEIAADAPLGTAFWRLATAEGATPSRRFIVGDLPEVVEDEMDGDAMPVAVALPVTANGRIFPREDVDEWSFSAHQGQAIHAQVCAASLGSPFEPRIEVIDPRGRKVAEALSNGPHEAELSFTPATDETYRIRIHDINFGGLQNYVYRLTLSDGPYISAIRPLGARRGAPARFEAFGSGLPTTPLEMPACSSTASTVAQVFDVDGRPANPVLVELDDLDELLEQEPNNDPSAATVLGVPGIANGRVQTPGDVDCFTIAAAKDQSFDLDLRASRLGSPLDGVVVVLDPSGKELLRCDDAAGTDPQCRFTAPADGIYTLRVEDRLTSRGGPTFTYRLRVDKARPDFRLVLPSDAINFVRGKDVKFKIDVDAIAPLEVPIELQLDGMPAGVTVRGTQIAPRARQAELTFTVPEKIPVATGRMTVRGTATIDGQQIVRTAALAVRRGEVPIEQVYWAVALVPPFKFVGSYQITFEPRGGYVTRHYRLVRGGYTGPLEVQLADRQLRHLQGVTAPAITVPAGRDEFDYTIYLPPWMELGRTSRTCLMAIAKITDSDGTSHPVSFSTQEQNEQVVIRVSSGKLSVSLARDTILARPGKTKLTARVTREASQSQRVRVELVAPQHVQGISAEPVILAPSEDSAELAVDCQADCGPLNMPLVVRATTLDADRPAVAEAKLEIVPPR
jgi:hypothetical protein